MINEIICKNKNNNNGIKAIMKDGNLIKEPKAIVEISNNFIIKVDPNLVRNININPNTSFQTYLTKHIISSFHFSLVNENEVNKILKSLRTKNVLGAWGNIGKTPWILVPCTHTTSDHYHKSVTNYRHIPRTTKNSESDTITQKRRQIDHGQLSTCISAVVNLKIIWKSGLESTICLFHDE